MLSIVKLIPVPIGVSAATKALEYIRILELKALSISCPFRMEYYHLESRFNGSRTRILILSEFPHTCFMLGDIPELSHNQNPNQSDIHLLTMRSQYIVKAHRSALNLFLKTETANSKQELGQKRNPDLVIEGTCYTCGICQIKIAPVESNAISDQRVVYLEIRVLAMKTTGNGWGPISEWLNLFRIKENIPSYFRHMVSNRVKDDRSTINDEIGQIIYVLEQLCGHVNVNKSLTA
ncbi:hypothetical protein ACOME3_010049 [Neoechinorhynchus agilis]